ncbi:MAG: hypothetical protein JKX81_01530 [Arenicella sp.]|nr:hypothetical protein [Arenicella sp.]
MKPNNVNSNILILEDDLDQMKFLVSLTRSEMRKIISDETTSDRQRRRIRGIQIIKVSNTNSLRKAASMYKNVLLAVLDCNAPDTKGGTAHDQLVKTKHLVTGQHSAVDIATVNLPDTPITLISSFDRFHRTVNRYYESKHDLTIEFVRKNDPAKISENIEHHLTRYLNSIR